MRRSQAVHGSSELGYWYWRRVLREALDAGDTVAKSGDYGEADRVEPVNAVDLSELGSRIPLRRVISSSVDAFASLTQFLTNLDDLDYELIIPSLRDFSFSGNSFPFDEDHNSIY